MKDTMNISLENDALGLIILERSPLRFLFGTHKKF